MKMHRQDKALVCIDTQEAKTQVKSYLPPVNFDQRRQRTQTHGHIQSLKEAPKPITHTSYNLFTIRLLGVTHQD